MAQTTTGSTTNLASLAPALRRQFLDAYEREHATTAKLLRAFPPAQAGFRPHERSNTAHQLAWKLVAGERLALIALEGKPVIGTGFPPAPESWKQVVEGFDAQHDEIVRRLESKDEIELSGTVQFFTGPKQMGDWPMLEFLWFMLCDQIHHRGQLSVYLRMAGGRVPSIYGPSADEPWT